MTVLVTFRSGGRHGKLRRDAAQIAFLVLLLCALPLLVGSLHAVPTPQTNGLNRRPRTLYRNEGKRILETAWDHRQQVLRKPDCSHLVNEVYRLAGFPYAYATSYELYAGHANFARVRNPQSGDIIVWPGHAGIVVSPKEHTFYSSVSSGLHTEAYNGGYWQSQGQPRFYRYVVTNSHVLLTQNVASPHTPAPKAAVEVLRVPAVGTNGDPAEVPTAGRGITATTNTNAEELEASGPAEPPVFDVPANVPIIARLARPTQVEVAEAISELSSASGNTLRRRDLSKYPLEVAIFDQFRVERVEVKKDRGWATVRVESRVTLRGPKIQLKHRTANVKWELRRGEKGWLAVPPSDCNYVPRDVAVRVLAEQLATLTQSAQPSSPTADIAQQEAHLARILDALFQAK